MSRLNYEVSEQMAERLTWLRKAILEVIDEVHEELMYRDDGSGHEILALIYAALNLQGDQPALAAWIANRIPKLIVKDLTENTWCTPAILLTILNEMGRYLGNSYFQVDFVAASFAWGWSGKGHIGGRWELKRVKEGSCPESP